MLPKTYFMNASGSKNEYKSFIPYRNGADICKNIIHYTTYEHIFIDKNQFVNYSSKICCGTTI